MKLGKTNITLKSNNSTKLKYNHIQIHVSTMYKYKVWGRPPGHHTCCGSRAGLECQSRAPPTSYTHSATGSRNQEFVPPLRHSRCAMNNQASLGHIPACAVPMRHNNWASLGTGNYTCEIIFHTYFQSSHSQYKYIHYIHQVYQ